MRVVGKDDELVLLALVADKVEALLHVRRVHPMAHGGDVGDVVGDGLKEQYTITIGLGQWRDKVSQMYGKYIKFVKTLNIKTE